MPNPEHAGAPFQPLETLTRHHEQIEGRFLIAERTLEQGMELFQSGYEMVNNLLAEAQRSDLTITHPAEMRPANHPLDIVDKFGNFAAKFRMITGTRETGEKDRLSRPISEPIPATAEEILVLGRIPIIRNEEDARALNASPEFPLVSTSNPNHSVNPAFTRMLILFPDFTTQFVTGFSAPENAKHEDRYETELFTAYQLMSRLVDISDPFVTIDDKVDEAYLIH
ncbi:MAG: hypothetical protein JWL89_343 [Candidatus Saccharibacteria bacterium]|nr:hypothetical protein [Candidatus Saccharibacteria bacterium]